MNILFLGGIFPKERYSEIIDNSKGPVQYAADALQKSFIEGLAHHFPDFKICNIPFIGSWPSRYNSITSLSTYQGITNIGNCNIDIFNSNFLNLTCVKLISRYFITKNYLTKYFNKHHGDKNVLFIYSVHSPFLKAAIDVKQKLDNFKIVLIVPDLPEFMGGTIHGIKGFLKRLNNNILNKLYDKIDGFVLLSEYMRDRIIKKGQPYVVVEGIFNPSDEPLKSSLPNTNKKIIMYSGTLARRYNVMELVYAAKGLERDDFTLEIYGDGNTKEEIVQLSNMDCRIKYCGQQPRDYILQRQREATLLVNPRTSEGEYTKYSFPSKTMEYLASGTPTLLYRLPAIPIEYYNYCFSIEPSSHLTLKEYLNMILNKDSNELREMGLKGRDFILHEKNPIKQTKKILLLLDKIL